VDRHARRLGGAIALVVALVLGIPTGVAADCDGPACGPMDAGAVEGPQALLVLAILVVFATVMAVAEARRR
jgi:hypothetical protein